MEGHELLSKVNRVKAPPDFEERVFAKLGEASRARGRRQTVFHYAFAGTAALFLVGVVLLSQFFMNRKPQQASAGQAGIVVPQVSHVPTFREDGAGTVLPVLETVDYSSEVRDASYQPRTVYILEQVSEVRPSEIKY
jgi:hypothetical protein